MKKIGLFLLILALVLALAACGNSEPANTDGSENPTDQATPSGVAIVIGDGADRSLAEQIQAAIGSDAVIVSDAETTSAGVEILLGKTNRPASAKVEKGVRERDGVVRFVDSAVVIQGGTEEKLSEMVTWFVQNSVPAWKNSGSFETADGDYASYGLYKLQSLFFDDNGIYSYSIVTANGEQTEAALLLQENIANVSSYTLPIIAPSELKDGENAIIFTSSGAREAAAKSQELKEKEGLIEATADSLYLCGGSNMDELVLAYMFLGKTLDCQLKTGTLGQANMNFANYRFKFTTAIDDGNVNIMVTQVGRFEQQKEFNILQGGGTDGTYVYYVMQDQMLNSGDCIILKMDPKTWEILQVSEPLPLEHGNDLTYLPDTNQLLVTHCSPDDTAISLVDADTLELVEKKQLDYHFYSMGWNEKQQKFAVAASGKMMLVVDKDYKLVGRYSGIMPNASYQGYSVDDDFVYCLAISGNVIHVYTWDGFPINRIPIPVASEMENMVSFGDLRFTAYLNSGADIYATVFYKTLK